MGKKQDFKDTLITYETGILAKQAGFNIPVRHGVYGPKMKLTESHGWERNKCLEMTNWNAVTKQQKHSQATSIPTQSLLQKWLREKHSLWVEITLWGDGIGTQCMIKEGKPDDREDDQSRIVRAIKTVEISIYDRLEFDYEKTLEKGLKEALKILISK